MMRRLCFACAIVLFCNVAAAQCLLSGADIINLSDPACSDRMLTYTESTTGADLIPLGYVPPLPVSSLTAVDGFRSYDSLNALHQDIALISPDVRVEQAGSTLSGRPIWAYVIGDADSLTVDGLTEPAVMMIGGIHAREWQTPEALTAVFETLAASTDDDGMGSYLRDNLNVVLLPVLNIDGFLQTQAHHDRASADPAQPREGRMRRRNLRNPNSGSAIDDSIDTTADNFWGVDLNRNSAHGWGLNGGSSNSVSSLVYRGSTAASEPEIQALQSAADLGPTDRLRLFIDVHSFGQVFFAPGTGNARRDSYSSVLGAVMRAVHGFKYTYVADPNNGGIGLTSDWFAHSFEIPSWTLEIEPINGAQEYGGTASHGHSGFILPDAEAARMRDEIVSMNLIGFYRQAGPPHVTAVRIADMDSGELRFSASWQDGSVRNLQTTENKALVPGANYRLYVAFSKPMRFQSVGGVAEAYPGQQTGPTSGQAELQIPALDATNDAIIDLSNIVWLDQPDGVSDGYQRYIYDAATIDFALAASLNVAASEPAVLSLLFSDMSDFNTDADPGTVADWSNGSWVGLENHNGSANDAGGIDCNMSPFIAMDADAMPPLEKAECRDIIIDAPPAPVPAPPKRGGGNSLWLLVLLPLRYLFSLRPDTS
jgi:hypothetical protein